MNYIGFVKILKKHDKLTDFNTKEAFISRVVNSKKFAKYNDLLELMTQIESLYNDYKQKNNLINTK